jgi:hypothetical protein
MKNGLSVVGAVMLAVATAAAAGEAQLGESVAKVSAAKPTLQVIGPVEAYDAKHEIGRVLGQTVALPRGVELVVGDSVSVIGTSSAEGKIVASVVADHGLYVAGASEIFLSGTVQKVNSAVGTAVVNGVSIELTSLLAKGPVSPVVGTAVQVSGTQPAFGGVVLANSISGGGEAVANSISGGGAAVANSISGGGSVKANSISGGGNVKANSISGGGDVKANSISGGGNV